MKKFREGDTYWAVEVQNNAPTYVSESCWDVQSVATGNNFARLEDAIKHCHKNRHLSNTLQLGFFEGSPIFLTFS